MRKKPSVLLCIIVILLSFYAIAFSQERPKDFRGLKWGTHISKVQGLALVAELENGIKTYHRPSDKLEIGKGKVDDIVYVFKNQQLIEVILSCKDYSQYLNLKSAFLDIYGSPDRVVNDKQTKVIKYDWYANKDDEANIELRWIEWWEGYATMKWKAALKKDAGL